MKRPYLTQISKIRKALLKSIQTTLDGAGLDFYASGYTDETEPDDRLKLAKLAKPLRFKLPVTTDDDLMEIEFLKSGFVSDSYGGGACIESWAEMPIENLEKCAFAIARHFNR